jgi:hypothetical protein
MNEHGKKVISITAKVIALAILTIGIYLGILKLLIDPICIIGDWPFSGLFLVTILSFDGIWFATIKFWPFRNIYIKIFSTLFIIAFSFAVATCYIGNYLLRDFRY